MDIPITHAFCLFTVTLLHTCLEDEDRIKSKQVMPDRNIGIATKRGSSFIFKNLILFEHYSWNQ